MSVCCLCIAPMLPPYCLCCPLYCLCSLLRYITFKLSFDLRQIPALNELMRAGMRLLLSGDKSEWDRALQVRPPAACCQLSAQADCRSCCNCCSCCSCCRPCSCSRHA